MVSRVLRGRCASCSVGKKHSRSSSLHQESTTCCSTIRKQSIWKHLDLPTRQQNSTYSPRNARLVLPRFLDKDTGPADSPELNRLDYCNWDEFAQAINWSKVRAKSSLISELKRDTRKIRLNVVRESCFL